MWGFTCAAGGGTALRATTGEGGITHGAGAEWGVWTVEGGGLVFTGEDGVRYDAQGVEIVGEASDGEWIDCGALEYGTVSARLDGEGVRISYTATDEHSADDAHEIRSAVEARLGIWLKTPSDHHWSDAEGAGEAVQTVARYEYQPTHEITLGGSVYLVCLIDGVGFTRDELEFETSADWTYSPEDEGWLFQGQRVGGSVRTI